MNDKALDAFIEKLELAKEITDKIKADLDDHMGFDPDHITWGHFGDVSHVLDALVGIANFMGIEV